MDSMGGWQARRLLAGRLGIERGFHVLPYFLSALCAIGCFTHNLRLTF
jgi:hypothetical protein